MKKLLKNEFPEIFSQIDIEETKKDYPDINLDKIAINSHFKLTWICKDHLEHRYVTSVFNRTRKNTGCPYCSNAKVLPGFNDLQTRFPGIAKEFAIDSNNGVLPSEIMPGNQHNFWWRCPKCKKLYKATPNNRTKHGHKSSCPYCAGIIPGTRARKDILLKDKYPELFKQLDIEKNKQEFSNLNLDKITTGSGYKLWWKCSNNSEHPSYQALIYNRINRNAGCPYCANKKVLPGYNDLATTHPEIAKYWDYQKNGNLTPSDILAGSDLKVWWLCPKGHSYFGRIANRIRYGCPKCSHRNSVPELTIYELLKTKYPSSTFSTSNIQGKEIDIISNNIYIEYDGYAHNFEDSKDRDERKNIFVIYKLHHELFRIKETKDPEYFNKYEEQYDGKLKIFYVSSNYRSDNTFQRLSDILFEIFGIRFEVQEIKDKYFEMRKYLLNKE